MLLYLIGFGAALISAMILNKVLKIKSKTFFVVEMLRFLFETNKVISCDIAELNPLFDRDGTTALLAARLVDFMAAIK